MGLFNQARTDCTMAEDRKSTRLNSSHHGISYAVFCLKKKNWTEQAANPLRADVETHCAVLFLCAGFALPILPQHSVPRDGACRGLGVWLFFFNDPGTPEIYTLSLHDALPICAAASLAFPGCGSARAARTGRRRCADT